MRGHVDDNLVSGLARVPGLTVLGGAVLLASALMVQAERVVDLPSGLTAHLQEVISDGDFFRYRFVAPDFQASEDVEATTADLEMLCQDWALPDLLGNTTHSTRVVVSLASAPSEFGVANPDIAQVFEVFRLENDRCIWEVF